MKNNYQQCEQFYEEFENISWRTHQRNAYACIICCYVWQCSSQTSVTTFTTTLANSELKQENYASNTPCVKSLSELRQMELFTVYHSETPVKS